MLVRRYVVSAMPEAVSQIRRELGKEAVILSSKKIRQGGWLGLFKRERFEVIAAMAVATDATAGSAVQNTLSPENAVSKKTIEPTSIARTASLESGNLTVTKETEINAGQTSERMSTGSDARDNRVQAMQSDSASSINGKDLLKEMQEMRRMLYAMAHPHYDDAPPQLARLVERLESQGVSAAAVRDMVDYTRSILEASNDAIETDTGGESLRRQIVEYMTNRLHHAIAPAPLRASTRIVAFVGPTGVGKTTTIAKLAAQLMLEDNRHPALITTDTYRIAAVDQLRTYATILGIPLEVAFSPEDIRANLHRLNEHDVVLVDTAGRNYRDHTMVDELHRMLDQIQPDEIYLNLSLTAKESDLLEVTCQFERTGIDKFVFTKLDETKGFGAAYNLIERFGRPMAYMTHGQNVPADFEVASLEKLCTLIVGDEWDGRSS